jgi:hypothetical protein
VEVEEVVAAAAVVAAAEADAEDKGIVNEGN